MKKNKSLKVRIKNGERLFGCWIEMFSPIATEIITQSGYDVAMIDLEHGPGSYLDAIKMIQAMSKTKCEPLIRSSSNDVVDIKRILDIGPKGIMVPNVRSVEEAKQVVSACRYAPQGVRGAATPIVRASQYGKSLNAYLEFMEKDFLLIIQVEEKGAVEQIDEIANVDGVDMIFIGPLDLSGSLGKLGNFKTVKYKKAYAEIERGARAAGKALGTITIAGWDAKQLYKNGHSLVLSGADNMLLKQAAEDDVAQLRKAAKRKT